MAIFSSPLYLSRVLAAAINSPLANYDADWINYVTSKSPYRGIASFIGKHHVLCGLRVDIFLRGTR
jgi:hypothetical protein